MVRAVWGGGCKNLTEKEYGNSYMHVKRLTTSSVLGTG